MIRRQQGDRGGIAVGEAPVADRPDLTLREYARRRQTGKIIVEQSRIVVRAAKEPLPAAVAGAELRGER